jgi:hypothetical protein
MRRIGRLFNNNKSAMGDVEKEKGLTVQLRVVGCSRKEKQKEFKPRRKGFDVADANTLFIDLTSQAKKT